MAADTGTPKKGGFNFTFDGLIGGLTSLFGAWSLHDQRKRDQELAYQYGGINFGGGNSGNILVYGMLFLGAIVVLFMLFNSGNKNKR